MKIKIKKYVITEFKKIECDNCRCNSRHYDYGYLF